MTANAMEGDREKCLQSGMNDYIGKPIEPKLIEAKLDKWLLSKNVPITMEKTLEIESLPEVKIEHLVSWDQTSALERLMNKKTLLISLIKTFIEEMPEKLEQLLVSINNENIEDVALLAHTIKGAAANLSALKLAQYCSELEEMAKSTQSTEPDYLSRASILQQYYFEVIDEFKDYIDSTELNNSTAISLTAEDAVTFLTTLCLRLADSDYIESEELTPLVDSHFSEDIDVLLVELQQMITLFDLNNAEQLSKKILSKLQHIVKGKS